MAPLRKFLSSYREHPAGAEHELVVIFNGVTAERRPALRAELEGIEHRPLTLSEPVQDLAAYAQAAGRLEHDRVCFLNSHTVILAPDWLAKLNDALDQPRVGLAGASGSWASLRSWALHAMRLPSAYRGVLPDAPQARAQFGAIDLERGGARESPPSSPTTPGRALGVRSERLRTMFEQLSGFEGFPAAHLRTNAFMVERVLFAGLRMGRIARKMDAYRLESGRESFTNQVHGLGLRTVVVAREGAVYDRRRWPLSATFWQGDQEDLLIADNQTRLYGDAGIDRRRLLSACAWGPQADPRLAASSTAGTHESRGGAG
ncbi:MAG TPA: hypothetical protein VGX16_04755 [Solirubrobacteraceae bacterium]|nr:hypothetical protein [Solirubrobacteraceae bacterium]